MFIEIIPKSLRARNRIKEHGRVMLLTLSLDDKFLVYSLNNTWKGEQWCGWFTYSEADYIELKRK